MAMIDCAQQSVQWAVGILRHFGLFLLSGFFLLSKFFLVPP